MPKRRVILDKEVLHEPSEAEQVAVRWDKAMRNAFKGIVPRPAARAMLMRSPLNPSNQKADDDA